MVQYVRSAYCAIAHIALSAEPQKAAAHLPEAP